MLIEDTKREDVLTAARRRMAGIFDNFSRIVVSVSSGKDSTVIRNLAIEEARKRNRKIELFFLDQEAEYQSTVDLMTEWMYDPEVVPKWFQVPIQMTNATSHKDYFLYAWGPGEPWMREKDPIAIHTLEEAYPQRFYDFFEWYEKISEPGTAFIIGVRSRESLNRNRATTKRPAFKDWTWTSVTKGKDVFRVYPIYDWAFGDVWKYIHESGLKYNKYYDRMFAKHGVSEREMRVSNLIHEQAFRCLVDLQEFEPETYQKMINRLGGVHCAALYAKESYIYSSGKLPKHFKSWREYRDYLLSTTDINKVERFTKRFDGQGNEEETCKGHVRQILTNDWENNVPVTKSKKEELMQIWWDRL